jgi:hypothetical protein
MKMYLMIILALTFAGASILKAGNDVVKNQKVVSTNTKVEKSIVEF